MGASVSVGCNMKNPDGTSAYKAPLWLPLFIPGILLIVIGISLYGINQAPIYYILSILIGLILAILSGTALNKSEVTTDCVPNK